ncbi:Tetratricopeptide repeat protein [Aquisphaera giovannonii]|uniref:Tetratricopeptide repeat protein n=1 Tax=Aquisphaera giovannonii TaxID=406548 RepID=A0A5B9VXZ0_9BACT|nr:tetratricopeptide repeat protein [Aquisphaera giovannonii]QEH32857.1 Tetratricopeptide repeat protein [Aquisphaera giovannonii]
MGGRIVRALAVAALLGLVGGAAWWVMSRATARPAFDPLAEGRSAYDRGDFRRAAALARDRLKAEPGNPEAVRLLARSSARQGRHDVATGLFDRLGVGNWEAEDLFLAAAGHESRGEKDPAYDALRKAIERDPHHPDTLFVLARLDAREDNPYAAAELAGRLAGVPGWEARGEALLGTVLADLSDPAGAAGALERALRLDPSLKGATFSPAEARRALARDHLISGRPDLARAALGGLPEEDRTASWLLSRVLLQEGRTSEAVEALKRAGPGARGEVTAPEPAPFVGAGRCVECHRDIASLQMASHHARTFSPPAAARRLPLPDRPTTDPHDPTVSHAFPRAGGEAAAETRRGDDDVARAVIAYALGSGARARTWIGQDDAGLYRELRLTRYRGGIWDVTTGIDPQPRPADAHNFLGKPLSADGLRHCLFCHTTDFRAARDREGPTAADPAIGCERCHGPGGNHLRAVADAFPDPSIGRPRLASDEEVTRLCGTCHSPRGQAASPDSATAARFQVTSMSWSRCYTESAGHLSCLTCHDPHRDAEHSAAFYEARCLACHSTQPPPSPAPASASRTRPAALPAGKKPVSCPVNPTSDCIRCHMPAVDVAVPHVKYTDHHIRSRQD